MTQSLEYGVEQLLKQIPQNSMNPQMMDQSLFAEQQNDFGMPSIGSFLKVSDGNIAVIGLGLVMSSSVGGVLSGFLPSLGKWTTIMAGVILMYFGKNKKLVRDIGVGVLLGGLANIFSGLGSSLGGILGGGGMSENMMNEVKETYGGSDGVYPTNPDRRVFQ